MEIFIMTVKAYLEITINKSSSCCLKTAGAVTFIGDFNSVGAMLG